MILIGNERRLKLYRFLIKSSLEFFFDEAISQQLVREKALGELITI